MTNVLVSLCEPLIVDRLGLRHAVVVGASLMFAGCAVRSGFPRFANRDYAFVIVGTVLVGAAQPFFQCTPALLAANWFGPDERTLATTIALNANQVGIAVSYLVGTELVHDMTEMQVVVSRTRARDARAPLALSTSRARARR